MCRNHYTSKYVKVNRDKRSIEGKLPSFYVHLHNRQRGHHVSNDIRPSTASVVFLFSAVTES